MKTLNKNSVGVKEALDIIAQKRVELNDDKEFLNFIGALAAVALGVMYEQHGEEFYSGFLSAAQRSPTGIKINTKTVH